MKNREENKVVDIIARTLSTPLIYLVAVFMLIEFIPQFIISKINTYNRNIVSIDDTKGISKDYFKASHVHIKSGREYMYLEMGEMQDEGGAWRSAVIYRNSEGNKYVRQLNEFLTKFREV